MCLKSAWKVAVGNSVKEDFERGMLSHWAGLMPFRCQSSKYSNYDNLSRLAKGLWEDPEEKATVEAQLLQTKKQRTVTSKM